MRLIVLLMVLAFPAYGQSVQCVEVPQDHKIVFIPWIIPVDELIWKWHHAKQPEATEPKEDPCPTGLVISPSECVPGTDA